MPSSARGETRYARRVLQGSLLTALLAATVCTGDSTPSRIELSMRDPDWIALEAGPYGHSDDTRPSFLDPHAHDDLRADSATTYPFMMARPDELSTEVLGKAHLVRDRVAAAIGDASYLEERAPRLRAGPPGGK